MMEGRRDQFVAEVVARRGLLDRTRPPRRWTRPSTAGSGTPAGPTSGPRWPAAANPVAGPYFNFSLPEPSGVVGVIAPQESSLLGFVSVVAPAIATGNAVVVIASSDRPLPAVSLSEALATSDLPGGVLNLLTGSVAELAPWLAGHRDVNCLDLTGVDRPDRIALAEAAADNVKRVYAPAAVRPVGRARHGPAGRVHRDQDGVAPDGCVSSRHAFFRRPDRRRRAELRGPHRDHSVRAAVGGLRR